MMMIHRYHASEMIRVLPGHDHHEPWYGLCWSTGGHMHFFFMPSTTADSRQAHRAMSTYNEAYGDEETEN